MTTAIRQANLESDRALILETLSRYLTPLADGSRYDWLYRSNPHGQARVWIGVDKANDGVVGMASAFPRRMYVGEREEVVWVLGDFCINEQYRSLGPALQLQRACLVGMDSEPVGFCYDFPSTRMMAVYKRLGITSFRQMLRLAKPLRIDRHIAKLGKIPLVSQGLCTAGNFVLALQNSHYRRTKDSTVTVSSHQGHCGEEFSDLARKIGGTYGICIQRSAEYLDWRYLANPLRRYEWLTARRDGRLAAYAVFTHTGEDAILVDLFGIEDPAVIGRLVSTVVTLLRERGVVTVSVPIVESHPWVPLLHGLGFRAREARPVVVYASPCSQLKSALSDGTPWFLMHGDRDS